MKITLSQIAPIAALVFSVYAVLTPSSLLFAQQQQQTTTSNYSFVTAWGSSGSGFGKFSQPLDIATDSTGNVYVTDFTGLANQVQKFSSNGSFWRWRICKSALNSHRIF
jgi:hypothetical protein